MHACLFTHTPRPSFTPLTIAPYPRLSPLPLTRTSHPHPTPTSHTYDPHHRPSPSLHTRPIPPHPRPSPLVRSLSQVNCVVGEGVHAIIPNPVITTRFSAIGKVRPYLGHI